MRRAHNSLVVLFGFFFLLVGVTLSGCGGSEGSPPDDAPPVNEISSNKARVTAPVVSSGDAATFANDNLAFSVDMYLALRSSQPGNFLFSQTSISTALAMLYAGAGTTTAAQMSDTLHFSLPAARLHAAFNALDLALTTPPSTSNGFQLTFANSLWIQKDFSVLPGFLDTLAENYGAGLFVEDFQSAPEPARNTINGWVAHRTEGQIPSLFPQGSINTLTRLVLANAVYFHGDWKVKFKKDSPNEIFHTLSGDVSVPTMHGANNAAIWSGAGWNAGVLDYVGNTTSMIIVVPDAGTFAAFESGLTFESLSAILAGAGSGGRADLIMPRFKFSTDVGLNSTLSALGMPEAFSDGADFSGINGGRDLRIQSVIHQAIINVDESGTTASAATGVSVGVTSLPPTLVVNRPFLFFVRHNPTGAILFQGRVVDPSK
ncbi:MAG TPA: serpin family protein [Steroidobacteraceae bacterium]|nr:serpin family protein [Steroidobacteraceae bacterium]